MGRPRLACTMLVGLAACSDPRVTVTIAYQQPDLRAQLASLTVAVVQLPRVGDRPVTCDEVEYGAISALSLDGGRRASASALADDASLDGVPRLGDKLFLLDGKDAAGNHIAGGCTYVGDIAGDTPVAITAEVAPRVRLIGVDGVRDPTVAPGNFSVALFQPWKTNDQIVPLGGREVRVDVRDRARDQPSYATATSCASAAACPEAAVGVATVPIASVRAQAGKQLATGPIEVVVHAPWATEPLVVRAFEPLPQVVGSPIVLAPASFNRPNQADPSWALLTSAGRMRAAAIHATSGASPIYRIVTTVNRIRTLDFVTHDVVVGEPVHSLVSFGDEMWTVTAHGWRQLVFPPSVDQSPALTPGDGRTTSAASELVALERCSGTAASVNVTTGVLARLDDGELYVGYGGPRASDVASTDLQRLVDRINGTDSVPPRPAGRVIGNVCLTWRDNGVHRTLVLRRNSVLSLLNVDSRGEALSPISSGFQGYEGGSVWRLAGGALDVTGPHLQSFALTTTGALTDDDGRLEGDLTGLPTDTSISEVDGVALAATSHVVLDATRLQLTFLPTDGRAPLTGLSGALAGIAPKLNVVTIEPQTGSPLHVAAVATSEQLALFRFEALP